jgi:hypothetical protein
MLRRAILYFLATHSLAIQTKSETRHRWRRTSKEFDFRDASRTANASLITGSPALTR